MIEKLRKQILYFNEESRAFFHELKPTSEYSREQIVEDVVQLVSETKEAERGFLLNYLLDLLDDATPEELQLLERMKFDSLDIPTKNGAILLYNRFFPEELREIVQKAPPVRFLTKQAKILAIPHFESVRLFIAAFAGETEIDILLPLFERLTLLREKLLAEYILAVLRDIALPENESATTLTDLDATVYDMTSQELFMWFYEYFPLNSENEHLENTLAECIAVPGSAFDFYELFIERVRDGSQKDVRKLNACWKAAVNRTKALRQLRDQTCTLQQMYEELCSALNVQPITISEQFEDKPVLFSAAHLFELLSNDPENYSADLFDVISTQILFGVQDYLELMDTLAASGDSISAKIDELVRRELKFDSQPEIKHAALEVMVCGCKYDYEESIIDVMQCVESFETPAELLYAEIVMECFRTFYDFGIAPRTDGLVDFCSKVLANEGHLDVREVIYAIWYAKDDKRLVVALKASDCPAVERLQFYLYKIGDKSAFPGTLTLIEAYYFDMHVFGCYRVDYLTDNLEKGNLSSEFVNNVNADVYEFKTYLEQLSECLPINYLVDVFSDERFDDPAVAVIVDYLADYAVSNARIARIGKEYSRTRITLMHKHEIAATDEDPYTAFVLAGLGYEYVSDELVEVVAEQLQAAAQEQVLFAMPRLTKYEAERLLRCTNTHNSCLILLSIDSIQQEFTTSFLENIKADQLYDDLVEVLVRLTAANKLDVSKLAEICLQGIVAAASTQTQDGDVYETAKECLALVSELPPHSVDEDTRRRVYMSCETYLEAASSEIRNRARKVRICWML